MEIVVGSCYHLADRPGVYAIVQINNGQEVLVQDVSTKAQMEVPSSLLRHIVNVQNNRVMDLKLIGDERKDRAKEIYDAIEPLLKYKRIPTEVIEVRSKETEMSVKTLKKWLRRYRQDPRLSTLTRKRRKDAGEKRFEPLVEQELANAVAALMLDGNLLLKDAHEDMVDAIKELSKKVGRKLKRPDYTTLFRRHQELSEKEKAEARLGKRIARLTHGTQRGSLQDNDHPLAFVQVDHLELPVMVVDEEHRVPIHKAWITVLIDVFSRCVAGYYITLEAPSNLSLGLAMVHAILSKDETLKMTNLDTRWPICGFMWTVHADNAKEFHGNMLELAAQEYMIELMYRKVKTPNYGGYIESYLGTLSEDLRRIPGSTREGPQALGDTNPAEEAIMTLAELEQYILTLIITYHHSPHTALSGLTPLARFEQGMRGGPGILPVGRLRQASDPEKLRLDFMPCDERVVGPKGIVWDYLWYNDIALQRWVNARDLNNKNDKRKFLIRRDPRDLSKIYFWDPEKNEYLVIGTNNISRPSITLWELKAILAYLKAKGVEDVDEDLLFQAREERRNMRADAKMKTVAAKRARAREQERERLAKRAVAEGEAKKSPPPTTKPEQRDTDVVGTAYKMDWGG